MQYTTNAQQAGTGQAKILLHNQYVQFTIQQ